MYAEENSWRKIRDPYHDPRYDESEIGEHRAHERDGDEQP